MSKNEIKFTIGATGVDKATSDVKKFQQTTTREMTQAEKSVASSIGKMIAQYASLAVAINEVKKAITTGIDFNQFKESQETAFTVMMKSADRAKAKIEELRKFAIKNPLTFKETVGSSKQLLAYGFDADELVPTIERLGTVALATGNKLDDVAYVFGTLRAQGRAYSRDLMQFGTRGIPIYEELSKVLGVSVNQVQKLTSQGKVGFREVEKAFINMTSAGGRFDGLLDKFMDNAQGKAMQLGGMWETALGDATKGLSEQIKRFLDSLTDFVQSNAFMVMIDDLNDALTSIGTVVLNTVTVLLKNLPKIISMLKVIITMKLGKYLISGIGSIPTLVQGTADKLHILQTMLKSFTVSGISDVGKWTSAFGALKGVLSGVIASLGVAGVLGVAAVGVGAVAVGAAHQKTRENMKNDDYVAKRVKEVYAEDMMQGYSVGVFAGEAFTPTDKDKLETIKGLATLYKKTSEEVAAILYNEGLISREIAVQAGVLRLSNKEYSQAISNNKKNIDVLSTAYQQANYLSSITGRDTEDFLMYDDDVLYTLNANGALGAEALIAGFAKKMKDDKAMLRGAFTEAMEKANLEAEMNRYYELIPESFGDDAFGLAQDTKFDEKLIERILEIQKELASLGAPVVIDNILPKLKELDKWWLPDEARVAATVDAFDDIELIYEKALYNAEAEIAARRKIIEENLAIAQTEADKLHWAQQLRDIDKQREEIIKNITKEAERQRDASKFNVLLNGNDEYFKDKQAKAFKAYEGMTVSGGVPVSEKIAGIYDAYKDDSPMQMLVHGIRDFYNNIESFDIKGSFKEMWDSGLKEGVTEQAKSHLEGTEVGSIMSTGGLGVVPQMVAAFMEMLMSIENVNKVLNPFSTIFESMKNIIEPFVNSALKPIVNILEMIGEMLGKVLAPIISYIQIVMSALYVALLPLNIIISVVGEAFAWFNDSVIYPIGNALIDTINAVIKALNKIPFVSIKYIDRINKVSDALDNLAGGAQNMQSSLSSTINYLTKKLNALVDKQVESARSLYEVGAITGAEYEAQIAEINRGRLETDLLMISKADQQIEDAQGMLSRLYELALLDATIANNQLTDEQVKTLLKDAGLVTESQETMFAKAVRTALDGYGGATAKGIEAGIDKIITNIPKINNTYNNNNSNNNNSNDNNGDLRPLMTHRGGGSDINKSLNNAALGATGGAAAGAMIGGPVGAVAGAALGGLIGFFSRDVGSGNIPYDHLALVHKGEGIVPATFMEAIRSGELTLSGRGAGSGVTVVVNVEGSVQAENNLADTIAEAIYTRRSRGLVTV